MELVSLYRALCEVSLLYQPIQERIDILEGLVISCWGSIRNCAEEGEHIIFQDRVIQAVVTVGSKTGQAVSIITHGLFPCMLRFLYQQELFDASLQCYVILLHFYHSHCSISPIQTLVSSGLIWKKIPYRILDFRTFQIKKKRNSSKILEFLNFGGDTRI